jgi:hypothetical protein
MARHDYTATGGQTVFTYTFQIFEDDEITVYQNGVLLVLTANYTVTNATLPAIGGIITLTLGATAGDAIALVQDIPFTRLIDYQTDGDWLADEVNSDFDRIYTLLDQQFVGGGASSSTLSDRLLRFSDSVDRSVNNNLYPDPVAGEIMVWDSAGDLVNATFPAADIGTEGVVVSVAQLRALDVTSTFSAYIQGITTQNDGGQAHFYFDAASMAVDDNGITTVKPNSISALDPGRWIIQPLGENVGGLLAANNLSDIDDASDSRDNLGLGNLATLDTVDTDEIDDDAIETPKILDQNVTLPKLDHIDQNNFLARSSSGTGEVEEVIPSNARTMLGLGALAVLDGFTGFLGGGAENFQFRVPIQGEDDYVILVQCFNVNQTMTQQTHNFPVAYSGAVASLPVVFAQGYGITGQKVSPTYSVDNSGEATTLTVSDFHLVSTSGNTRDVAVLSIGLIED